ncbi:hypothetical protein RHGRI_018912 [Rhododendron griersonianum]|uniref:Uncharacterized protein n=1 Tax=Rhododendron griersonianum TaxID=479676 RepID=A0AAV6K376_9ERIC|nr:hypothetical protein RHGRI_018912 [Rhododendron griersonianum]
MQKLSTTLPRCSQMQRGSVNVTIKALSYAFIMLKCLQFLKGGGVAIGGLLELIPCIARTAVAVGVDGIFMEASAPFGGTASRAYSNRCKTFNLSAVYISVSKGKQSFKIDLTPFRD